MEEAAVICEGITRIFRSGESEVHALRGVNLEVKAGELFMLVGPSGCGKTTLLSVIGGTLNQDQGRCVVFGQNLRELKGAELVRFRGSRIGFIFQSFNLIPTLTALENVAVPLIIQGRTLSQAGVRARTLLEQLGLGDRLASYPCDLSGGQQQRVAIARALVHDPGLIVCDEPTAALDHDTGAAIMDIFRSIARQGDRALIIVTHDPRIFHYADRIARLDDGRVTEVVSDWKLLH